MAYLPLNWPELWQQQHWALSPKVFIVFNGVKALWEMKPNTWMVALSWSSWKEHNQTRVSCRLTATRLRRTNICSAGFRLLFASSKELGEVWGAPPPTSFFSLFSRLFTSQQDYAKITQPNFTKLGAWAKEEPTNLARSKGRSWNFASLSWTSGRFSVD